MLFFKRTLILEFLFKIDKTTSLRGTGNETGTGLGLILIKEFIKFFREQSKFILKFIMYFVSENNLIYNYK